MQCVLTFNASSSICNPTGSVGSSHGITLFFMQIDTLHVLSLSCKCYHVSFLLQILV